MTSTPTVPWPVPANARCVRSFPVLDASGVAVDVSGWTVDAVIRDGSGGAVLYTWPSDLARVEAGLVVVTILPAVSATWGFRAGWYRVRVINPSDASDAHRVLQGPLTVEPD